MARKVISLKKPVDGLEAPRNSLELRIENSQTCSGKGHLPVEQDWPVKQCCPFEAPMKKLINEEISSKNSNTRQNTPSIVARLMGMDTMTVTSATKPMEKRYENATGTKYSNKDVVESIGLRSLSSNGTTSSRQTKPDTSFYDSEDFYRPRRREKHPQEEELQRFKKEFEAWQAARFRECSRFAELEEDLTKVKPVKSKAKTVDFEPPSGIPTFSAPTRIVILKPGPDHKLCIDKNDSWSSSPCSLEQRGNIEDFLEEVRERLKCEMQGKMVKRSGGSVVARGSGIETPYSEKLSYPKQIAQSIAKQAREMGTSLVRSESSKFDGLTPSSPEFISKDTRRFVSERLKNVLKRETETDTRAVFGGHSRSRSVLDLDRDERKTQTRSFRHGSGDDRIVHRESSSPRNLVRSLSAPVSGTSFGKLLLEDRHILTGAQIRRKLEASSENVVSDVKKRKKEKSLSFKEKVSNFRYNFSLRGKLFGKKIPLVMESCISEHFPTKDITSGPTVVSNFGDRHERDNFTEVPPSPASVCSSAQEEFWRQVDHLSPLSTPDIITPCDGYGFPRVFREISSNLTELRRQLNQLESDDPAEEVIIQPKKTIELEALESEDPAEAYVRDLLVASGLYDGTSSDKFLQKWETLSKPISISVFEEVEEHYKKVTKHCESSPMDNHKLLHDLLNEALSTVFCRPSLSPSFAAALRGKELLHCVWEIVSQHFRSSMQTDRTVSIGDIVVDDLVARDLRLRRWSGAMDDIVASIGREIESVVMEDLVDEILEDMKYMN